MSRRTLVPVALALALLAALAAPLAQEEKVPLLAPVPELCAACHGEAEGWMEHDGAHGPVAAGECLDCHAAHASRHPGLLPHTGARLCFTCHEEQAQELRDGIPHAAVNEGCDSCHVPHASEFTPLLKEAAPELCLECHEPLRAAAEASQVHVPFADGECSLCHSPHASTVPALLTDEAGALCSACHDTGDAEVRAAHRGMSVSADCATCHDPHGSERAGLLRARLHAPFESGDCDTCHSLEPGDPAALNLPAAELCGVCHSDLADSMEHAGHPGARPEEADADCTSCHSPHAGATAELLRAGNRRTCTSCHDAVAESFRTAFHAHPLNAEGKGCLACHDPHRGEDEGLLRGGGGMQTCNACHSGHAFFSHPMGKGVEDPSRPGQVVECLSCHQPHGSAWPSFLVADSNRDLCIRCHEDLSGR